MKESTPLYLLATGSRSDIGGGRWQFWLTQADGSWEVAESDFEKSLVGDRLALFAVVRGLEAIPQPARIILSTPSRYVLRGFQHVLRHPLQQGSQPGRRSALRNQDLWNRVSRARKFHQISLRYHESSFIRWNRRAAARLADSVQDDIRLALEATQREIEFSAPTISQVA